MVFGELVSLEILFESMSFSWVVVLEEVARGGDGDDDEGGGGGGGGGGGDTLFMRGV